MTNRVLDFSERPARLSARNSLLVIEFPSSSFPTPVDELEKGYPCEQLGDPDLITIPLSDIAVLIASHPQISLTHAVLSGMAQSGAIFIACDEKHMPASMLLPLVAHSLQAERFAAQASMPVPRKKQVWKQIVSAKIRAQARLLEEKFGNDFGLLALATKVRSGDPDNLEARAARLYWQQLLGSKGFRRDPESGGLNACLNYGYAVLRAIVARSLCGAGLHPCLGMHHHNRYNPFCLADDLMEPFRPLVDAQVAIIAEGPGKDFPLDKESKRALLQAMLGRFAVEGESRTLFDWISRSAASLADIIEDRCEKLYMPSLDARAAQP